MEALFEKLGENPIWIFVIILAVICIIVSKRKQNAQLPQHDSEDSFSAGTSETVKEIGDQDEVVKEDGWFRNQNVEQPVIQRTAEQQRIVDEYFIVKKYRTTTCISEYKKTQKRIVLIKRIIGFIGLLMAGFSLIDAGFNPGDAFENPLFIVGLIAIVAGWALTPVANSYGKKFEDSIKHTTAPKKLLTDAEYEQLVIKKIEAMNIAQLGLERLGLDPDQVKEIQPIILRDKVIDGQYSFIAYNKDNHTTHSSTQHVTYLYFTDDQLFVYKIQFDMCCNVQDEWAHEFFYKDICDIHSHTYKNILKYEDFEYEYSSVAFSIVSSNSQIGFEVSGDNKNVASIQAMKHKIREKKAQQ